MYYMIVDDSTGMMKSMFTWNENQDIPNDYPVDLGCSLMKLDKAIFDQAQDRFFQVGLLKIKDKNALTYADMFIEQPEVLSNQREVAKLREYLTSTDFYFIRHLETGEAIPDNVKQQRQDTRKRLKDLGY